MSEFLKTKFKSKMISEKEKKLYVYKVEVNKIPVEVTIDESTNTLDVYCWDYDARYTYRWGNSFSSDKTFKKFIGQPRDIHYFLRKLRIEKDEFSLSKSKRELYSYSLRNFDCYASQRDRTEWLQRVNQLDEDILAEEANGDINFWVYLNSPHYIDVDEYDFKRCKYSRQNLIIINGLMKVMEQISKED